MSPKAGQPQGSASSNRRRCFPKGGPTAADTKRLRAKLLGVRAALLRSSKGLADEALKSSGQDFSVDHMADHGSDNFEQDFTLSLLEGETELLHAIDAALGKTDAAGDLPFGVCEACAEEDGGWDEASGAPWIPVSRLEVLPYAALCVRHQEEQEEG